MTESTSEYKKRIEEIKQSIENEPYMAKMREDIAEGISKTGIRQATVEEQFQAVIDETTGKDVISVPEIIVARGGSQTLGERLDGEKAESLAKANEFEADIADVNVQLQQKAGKGNISVNDINKNLGKFDETYMSDDFLAQIAGTASVNSVPGDETVTTKKLVDKSVTPYILNKKLQDYLEIGLKWGLGAVGIGGGLVTTTTRIRTELVLLKSGDTIKLLDKVNYQYGYNTYDLDTQEHLFNQTYINTDTVVEETGYYRLFMRKIDDSDLKNVIEHTGNQVLIYSPNSIFNITNDKLSNKSIDINNFSDDLQKNIYSVLTNFERGTLTSTDGSELGSNIRIRTPLMTFENGTKLVINDSNYQVSVNRFDLSGNYIDFIFYTNSYTLSDEYKYRLVMRKIDDSAISDKINEVSKKLTILHPSSIGYKADKALELSQLATQNIIQESEVVVNSNSKNYTIFVGGESFIELEFYAKSSFSTGSKIEFLGQSLNIDNLHYKPFKIRLFNQIAGDKTLIFSSTNVITFKNVKASFKKQLEKNDENGIRFIGHRGISAYAPENTAPAFALATKFGLWGVECDVYQTIDGVWVLLHDPTINRTSDGTGDITSLTYSELLNYDFGSWKGSEFKDTPIMTLDEFMLMCKQSDLHAYIELKGAITTTNRQSLVELIQKYGMVKNTTILSSSLPRLGLINTIEPKLRIAYSSTDITQPIIDDLKAFNAPCVFDIGFSYAGITDIESKIRLAHDNNIEVEAWTVNDIEEYKSLIKAGIDGITTDLFNLEGCYL